MAFFMARLSYWADASSLFRFRDQTQTRHTRYDSSRRGIGPSQRPLPDDTYHSQETDIHVAGGIRTRSPSQRKAAQSALVRAATGIGHLRLSEQWNVRCRLRREGACEETDKERRQIWWGTIFFNVKWKTSLRLERQQQRVSSVDALRQFK